jgi:hypothetical protein
MQMPPAGKGRPLNEHEVDLLKRWISNGARYAQHWSYVSPVRSALPAVKDSQWPLGPIDRYIAARLDSMNLSPSREADRSTLARRVALALTGLPPTENELQTFLEDTSANAYEKYVDAQLDKPAFGERWARDWLDLARYADSCGYADDPSRTIWAYRDYVIEALNNNMPFDQFTIEQIAGDLLENPSEKQLIATAFHRNTMTNNEGGTNDEQYRNEAIVDRVNTTFAVWMGTTIACAQCHTHKYDPITQSEYFQVFDFFNQSQDADRQDESPVIELWDHQEDIAKRDALRAKVPELEQQLNGDSQAFEQWLQDAKNNAEISDKLPEEIRLIVALESLNDEQRQKALKHFRKETEILASVRNELQSVKSELEALKPRTTVPVMRNLPGDSHRQTHVQLRGNYQSLGDQVSAGVPAAFPGLPEDAPRNRLAFARWLVSSKNPLTARVVVNRYWEQLFGTGIVETCEEFGSQGELPSHPELLDWLALDLIESGWNTKALLKQMVMSAAYRQASDVSPEVVAIDSQNRYYARGPRFRLSAEVVRDQALAVSGLLSNKMYGPPVRPPQPEMGLKAAFGSGTDWETSKGPDRYRRGIYTSWRRSNPYPSMATFDAPNREVCTLRRSRTNTPLQALVTLNDPVFVEAAQALAQQMANEPSLERQIDFGFRKALLRSVSEAEMKPLLNLYNQLYEHYSSDQDAAHKLAQDPLKELPADVDVARFASLTTLANVILNLDEFLMPR